MRISIKILKDVDGLEIGTIKSIQIHQANALVREGIAEIHDPNKKTEEGSTKSKKAKK